MEIFFLLFVTFEVDFASFLLFVCSILCNNPFEANDQMIFTDFVPFHILSCNSFDFFVTILCHFDAKILFLSFNQVERALFLVAKDEFCVGIFFGAQHTEERRLLCLIFFSDIFFYHSFDY